VQNNLDLYDLDALTTEQLTELLDRVMIKLRYRDAEDLKHDFQTKSQRLTLEEQVAKRLAGQ
jgi:hypothetical protein